VRYNNTEHRVTSAQEERLLADHDEYIVALARKKVPRRTMYANTLLDDIEELAQKIRIKLWHISERQHIIATRAYISCIATTISIDMVREHKPVVPLLVSEDGELYQGNLMFTISQEAQDPADVLEQEERFSECIEQMVAGVLELPPCQQRALLCSLKKWEDDFLPFFEALKKRGVDIDGMHWPEEKKEQQSLRTSLAIARRKMRVWHNRYHPLP
jgi:DNA-directed RNA polymerase specialized sigma24 family protein